MNKNIQLLAGIAAKKSRRIIGLMSGTSLDGLDIAVCNIEGAGFKTSIHAEEFETIPYESSFKDRLRSVCFKEIISLQELTLLNKYIGAYHAELINSFLDEKGIDSASVDLIASHGQTIYHAPEHLHIQKDAGHATLQIGDADQIAVKTGILTISDFRQKNIAGGGEGAPLAAYGDLILFGNKDHDVLLLNIGGIANFTLLKNNGEIISSDIGPGNTLTDQTIKLYFAEKDFDRNAEVALSGKLNERLLTALKDHPFIKSPFPKTTGPELFNIAYLNTALAKTNTKGLSPEDILATLNQFTADLITDAIKEVAGHHAKIYASGGGVKNPLLMKLLRENISTELATTDTIGIDPDAKEAVLFALLANETVAGDPEVFSGRLPAVAMGKISFPY